MTEKEKQETLQEIKSAANSAPTAHDKAAPLAIYHFSRLLIGFAKEAEEQTMKVVKLTYFLGFLTVALLIMAVIQLVVMIFQN